jgi:hypothetical protein
MRRTALIGLALSLGGCQFVGNPFAGGGRFLYDTHTFHSNPNLPPESDETTQRVEGKDVNIQPLLPEPGDIWPGPMRPIPTMQDLQQQNMEPLPPPHVPAAPPAPLFPEESPGQGPPPSQHSILVPNGDGTSTLIAPDGSTKTVPTPK